MRQYRREKAEFRSLGLCRELKGTPYGALATPRAPACQEKDHLIDDRRPKAWFWPLRFPCQGRSGGVQRRGPEAWSCHPKSPRVSRGLGGAGSKGRTLYRQEKRGVG